MRVERQEAIEPEQVTSLGAERIVLATQDRAGALDQPARRVVHGRYPPVSRPGGPSGWSRNPLLSLTPDYVPFHPHWITLRGDIAHGRTRLVCELWEGAGGRRINSCTPSKGRRSEEDFTAQIEGDARQGGACLAPDPFQRTSPASLGSHARGRRYWASNNSMEPTWPAGSRCQRLLIDSGLAAGVSYSLSLVLGRGHGAGVAGFCPSCPALAGQAAHLEAVRRPQPRPQAVLQYPPH